MPKNGFPMRCTTARSWRHAVDCRLKGSGLRQASWMTIAAAAKARAPLSQSVREGRLGVEGATVVSMVDRLVKAGFAVSQTSETDRRVKHVVLTENGDRLYATVRAVAAGVRKELLAHIDAELAQATDLLERLHELIGSV